MTEAGKKWVADNLEEGWIDVEHVLIAFCEEVEKRAHLGILELMIGCDCTTAGGHLNEKNLMDIGMAFKMTAHELIGGRDAE